MLSADTRMVLVGLGPLREASTSCGLDSMVASDVAC